jgi:transposase
MLQFTFAGFEVQHMASHDGMLTITARALAKTSACPSCGEESSHIHSYYQRHPQDLPISGLQVQLVLRVRRFRCPNPQCARQTFAERLPNLPMSARQTSRLVTILESIAVVRSRASWLTTGCAISDAGECRYAAEASQKEDADAAHSPTGCATRCTSGENGPGRAFGRCANFRLGTTSTRLEASKWYG